MWKCCIDENDRAIFVSDIFIDDITGSSLCWLHQRCLFIIFLQNVLAEELQHSKLSAMCTKELALNSFAFTEVSHQCDILCEEQPCPTKLINCLLNIGNIVSASRVRNLFQSNHKVVLLRL